jgi:hypothetical protein
MPNGATRYIDVYITRVSEEGRGGEKGKKDAE